MGIFLDSIPVAGELLKAWGCTCHCSHPALPPVAHGAFSLGTRVTVQGCMGKKPWGRFAVLTWLAMANQLRGSSDLDVAESGIGGVRLVAARALVVFWDWMHLTRALFPRTGFILGVVMRLMIF